MRYSSAMTTVGTTVQSRRERARAATMAEIKQTALELMREQGNTDIRFSDIARAMGLTPPALYRYYADRDELLTDMITDAYRDLGAALRVPVHAEQPADPQTHLLLVAAAYRAWALDDPQRFALIFGPPVPGYAAPEDGPTVEAAQDAMANLAEVVHRAAAQGALGEPIVTGVDPQTRDNLSSKEKAGSVGGDLPLATHQAMLHAWASLHGFVCLEAYGHIDWFTPEAREGLFRRQIELAGLAMGFAPSSGR
jgi:AcrR family transcriptional regulator